MSHLVEAIFLFSAIIYSTQNETSTPDKLSNDLGYLCTILELHICNKEKKIMQAVNSNDKTKTNVAEIIFKLN